MAYAPHQQRVIEEKTELDEKLVKLTIFIVGNLFPTLSLEEQGRLRHQLFCMQNYSQVLGERIAAFPVSDI